MKLVWKLKLTNAKCKNVKIEMSNLIVAGLDGLDGFIGPIN